MDRDYYIDGLISGSVIGFFVGFVVAVFLMSTPSAYTKAIKECEKSLPRDKHCKVIGVVDDSPKAN